MNKICIIGGGNVGVTVINNLMYTNLSFELSLIDNHIDRGTANVLDFNHMLLKDIKLIDYKDLDYVDIIVIASGIKYNKNRNIFLKNSYDMISSIMSNINKTKFKGTIIVVSNPNDVLTTYVSNNYKGLVIGTGVELDNNRLKYYLGHDSNSFIIGEHGDSQVIVNNSSKDVFDYVTGIANKIVSLKGYTNFGVSKVVVDIIDNLINNKKNILYVSTFDNKYNISYGRPVIINNSKLEYQDINLSSSESNLLNKSIDKIKNEYKIFSSKKVIGIDLDDTITTLSESMLDEAIKYDKLIDGKGIINENTYLMGDKFGWSSDEKEEFFRDYRIKAIENAKVRPDAKEVLKRFIDKGYQVIIITARSDKFYGDAYNYTKNWLLENDISFSKLITNVKSKKDICIEYSVDYFIDDMPSNCKEVASCINTKVFMIKNDNNYLFKDDIECLDNFIEIERRVYNG